MCFSRNFLGFPGDSAGKDVPASEGDARDAGSIPGSGRSSRGGHDNPLQYSCLKSPMYIGAQWATVYGFTKSQTRQRVLSGITFVSRSICFNSFSHCEKSVYVFSTVDLTVQREVAVFSQVFYVVCNFSRSDVFIKQETFYKVDYSVSPYINIQEASTKK